MKTARRVDLTNLNEALHDMLVHAGCLEDDNCRIIVSTDGSRVRCDRENPRTEVTITRIEEDTMPWSDMSDEKRELSSRYFFWARHTYSLQIIEKMEVNKMKISEMLEREANRDATLERELLARGIVIDGNAGASQSDPSLRGEQKGHVVKNKPSAVRNSRWPSRLPILRKEEQD